MCLEIYTRQFQSKNIRHVFLICLVLLVIADFAFGNQPATAPVTILYHDGTGTIDLNNIETQPRANRKDYYMINVVLPKKYGIKIKSSDERNKEIFSSLNALADFITENRTR